MTSLRRFSRFSLAVFALLVGWTLFAQFEVGNKSRHDIFSPHDPAITPLHYAWGLKATSLDDLAYIGSFSMIFRADKPSNKIQLNAVSLSRFWDIRFKSDAGVIELSPESIQCDNLRQICNVLLPKDAYLMRNKQYTLSFDFAGSINPSAMTGVYRSKFKSGSYIYSTQFEPNGIRSVFPSIDHPAAKASIAFNASVSSPGYHVLSNGQETSRIGAVTSFKETPPMSTYLFAFVISNLNFVRLIIKYHNQEVPIRVFYDTFKHEEYARSVLLSTYEIMARLEAQFPIAFPIDKIDLVPVPRFGGEGMENLGLIIFEEDLLLTEKSMDRDLLIAHEIVHHFFGDSVTGQDWTDMYDFILFLLVTDN